MRRRRELSPRPGSQLYVSLYDDADPRALAAAMAALQPAKAALLFGEDPVSVRATCGRVNEVAAGCLPALWADYHVRVDVERMAEVSARLRQVAEVEVAPVVPPVATPTDACRKLRPKGQTPPRTTPSFRKRQGYLRPAEEGGVDAEFAWTRPGGDGTGVNIVHIEGAWNLGHEDLAANQGGFIGETFDDLCTRQHGTAVVGILNGDFNPTGVTGICPGATVFTRAVSWAMSPDETPLPQAIRRAADSLRAGDIILVELQHPGPDVEENHERRGYIPSEWWPHTLKAIKYATAVRGVIVVEAAGNGRVDLDDETYDFGDAFGAWWKNPFRRSTPATDSGAILVGAGAPPRRAHGPGVRSGDHGPERSRLPFSNHGDAVDVQAWGKEVTTCGYGSLQGKKGAENRWYTDGFGGTSSASPIVAGVLACLQGILRARGAPLLTPATARQLLRDVGHEQQPARGRPVRQRIGRRPDLRQLIQTLGA